MKFQPAEIGPDIVPLRGTLPPEALDVKDPLIRAEKEIAVDLMIQRDGETLIVMGKLSTELKLQCGRCLKWLDWPVEVSDFCVTFEPPLAVSIDLTENIREDIILRLPLRAACQLDAQNRCPFSGKEFPASDVESESIVGEEIWQALNKLKIKE